MSLEIGMMPKGNQDGFFVLNDAYREYICSILMCDVAYHAYADNRSVPQAY